MLGCVLDQLKNVSGYSPLVVATSDRDIDTPIAELAKNKGIAIFRGSYINVLERALCCAQFFNLDALIRISGDSPFIDRKLVTKLVTEHRNNTPDITTNVFPRTLPSGMSVEVISTSVLRRLKALTSNTNDQEHVTKYIYDHPNEFNIHSVTFDKEDYKNIHLSVDTQRDLDRAIWIMAQEAEVSLENMTGLARQWDIRYPK